MTRPESIIEYGDVDLKLGIKSSLPKVRSTLALAILFSEITELDSEIYYSQTHEDGIQISDDLKNKLLEELSITIEQNNLDKVDVIEKINSNALFTAQLESLIVAFELIWKLARIDFVEKIAASSERTGGKRFEKVLYLTTNADILHNVMINNKEGYYQVLLKWIGIQLTIDQQLEAKLISTLSILSEGAIFKLVDGDSDLIFNQKGIYQSLLDGNETVNLKSDSEPKGPLRILNSLLSESLNPNFNYTNWIASEHDGCNVELEQYKNRVENYLKLISKMVDTRFVESEITDENDKPFECNFSRNRIIFGAPGTGKSYTFNKESIGSDDNQEDYLLKNGGEYERVTFHPDYSYAQFVGTYKPTTKKSESTFISDDNKKVLDILNDKNKSSQEKYDLLFDSFKEGDLTRLPVLLGLYTDEPFKTRKKDGTSTVGDNAVERNHGRAIRPYVNLNLSDQIDDLISYEYVPGPFMRTLVKALKNKKTGNIKPYLLLIEEINRANVAAVFGDVFQLLDRDDSNQSEYPIQASEDMKKYLKKELGGEISEYDQIRIPDNMFIWATMNSADQGVYPMDTAFKRRWDFTYQGINEGENDIESFNHKMGGSQVSVNWNDLRKAINAELITYNINEDKLMGAHFVKKESLKDKETFDKTFKSKVIMYLFDDAAKQKRPSLFSGVDARGKSSKLYSDICEVYDIAGIGIFNLDIQNKFDNLSENQGGVSNDILEGN
ncbi:AAA family ATPase [Lactococcus petauri]|nr:AAA family ATPase [Lactococcus petauri]